MRSDKSVEKRIRIISTSDINQNNPESHGHIETKPEVDNCYLKVKHDLYKETNERVPNQITRLILAQQWLGFSGILYSPEHEQQFLHLTLRGET